jgi:hypothetical protein
MASKGNSISSRQYHQTKAASSGRNGFHQAFVVWHGNGIFVNGCNEATVWRHNK